MKRLVLLTAMAVAAMAALATPASAAPACSYTAIVNTFTVALDNMPTSAKVTITRDPANPANLIAQDANGATIGPCTGVPATISNTGTVEVLDPVAGHDATIVINEQNGEFAPGFNTPPDSGSPEINFQLDLGGPAGGTDTVQVDATDNADNILAGESAAGELGINLNASETSPDADIFSITGPPEKVDINSRKGDDTVSAIGAPAVVTMANPLTVDDLLLEGGNQNDLLRGGAGNDRLDGGTQDDDLNGGGGNDSLDGATDNDSLDCGAGADAMVGGTGVDFATYATATSPVGVTLDGVQNDGGLPDNFSDNVSTDVENVKGGTANDTITGNFFNNELTGNGGNDTVDGGTGDDKVAGSAGLDRLIGGIGNDSLFGGTEDDNLVGSAGNDKLTGDAGKDVFTGNKGLDRLLARDGAKDKKINCGPGKNKSESFTKDRRDPKPKSC